MLISTGNIISEIDIEGCLQKGLLPPLKQHSQNTLFLARFGILPLLNKKWYEANNVIVVPHDISSPKCPDLRPIEKS